MALNVEEPTVTIALPRLVCDDLAKAFPHCPIDDNTEAESLQRIVVALLEESHRHRSNGRQSTKHDKAESRRRVGPEIHGGPEGAYEREASTGRWRSISCTRKKSPVTAAPAAVIKVNADQENQEPEAMSINIQSDPDAKSDSKKQCADSHDNSPTNSEGSKSAGLGEAIDSVPTEPTEEVTDSTEEELATARAAVAHSQAEIAKLWKAARTATAGTSAETDLMEILRKDELDRALHQVEFEKQRLSALWDMLQKSLDVATFRAIVRKTDNKDNGRNLSVGAARKIFDAPANSETADRTRRMSRTSSRPTIGKRESEAESQMNIQSQSRGARLAQIGRSSSRGSLTLQSRALPQSSGISGMDARKEKVSFPCRGAPITLKNDATASSQGDVSKEIGALKQDCEKSLSRSDSFSVKDRVNAFQGGA